MKRRTPKSVSPETIELLEEYDLTPDDLTASELREVEAEMDMRRKDIPYMDGVEYFLLPQIRLRKADSIFWTSCK